MKFPMTIRGVSLQIVIEYDTHIGEIEVEDIQVYDVYDLFQWNNLTSILSDDVLKDIEAEFYNRLPEGDNDETEADILKEKGTR